MHRDFDDMTDEEYYGFQAWLEKQKCPNDGEQLHYHEGQTGEDRMGNAIYSEWLVCPKCGYESEAHEL